MPSFMAEPPKTCKAVVEKFAKGGGQLRFSGRCVDDKQASHNLHLGGFQVARPALKRSG